MVDLCLLKYLRSSLIDFHISTEKLSWLLLRGVHQDSKSGPVIAKANETFIMQYPRPISDDPSKISKGQPCPTSSGL